MRHFIDPRIVGHIVTRVALAGPMRFRRGHRQGLREQVGTSIRSSYGADNPGCATSRQRQNEVLRPGMSGWPWPMYKDEDWPGVNDVVREYINGDTLISRYKLGVPIYSDRNIVSES